jgi:hypothetical protein
VATKEHSFIVRIWSAQPEARQQSWRGHIEELRTGQRIYFSSLRDLYDFLAICLDERLDHCNRGKEVGTE